MPDDAADRLAPRAFPVPPPPVGMADGSLPQAQMLAAEPAAAAVLPPVPPPVTLVPPLPPVPVRLIFADLLATAADGSLRWERLRPGVEIARLYATPDGGPTAALLRYAAGARLARHEHTGFEHIYVLCGSQVDDSGEHRAGALLIHGPGTSHTISSKHGCIVLAIWERPVRFLE